jgi:hypothetical protein
VFEEEAWTETGRSQLFITTTRRRRRRAWGATGGTCIGFNPVSRERHGS